MSFDHFVHQMTLKYRQALAIAVLQTKPNNLTLDQYINRLKLVHNSAMDFDSDITICSDEFNYNDENDHTKNDIDVNDTIDKVLSETQETNDSVDILKNFNMEYFVHGNNAESNDVREVINLLKDGGENQIHYQIDSTNNNSGPQSTLHANSQSQNLLDAYHLIGDDVSISQGDTRDSGQDININSNESGTLNKNKIAIDAFHTLKNDSEQTQLYSFQGLTDYNRKKLIQSHDDSEFNIKRKKCTKENIEPNNSNQDKYPENHTDSKQTQLYSFHGFTDNITNVKHESFKLNYDKQNIKRVHLNKATITNDVCNDHNVRNDSQSTKLCVPGFTSNTHNCNKINHSKMENSMRQVQNDVIDSQQTQLYSLHCFRDNCHSEDQYLNEKFLNNKHKITIDNFGKDNSEKIDLDVHESSFIEFDKTDSGNIKDKHIPNAELDENEINLINNQNDIFDSQQTQLYLGFDDNCTHISQSQSQYMEVKKNQLVKAHAGDIKSKLQDIQQKQLININKDKESMYNKQKDDNFIGIEADFNKSFNANERHREVGLHRISQTTGHNRCIIDTNEIIDPPTMNLFNTFNNSNTQTQSKEVVFNEDVDMYNIDVIENRVEEEKGDIVSFKIIEELNRIKTYLNRKCCDGYATDSGYRSDSQSRSSFKTHLYSQESLVNRSAQCLVHFIANCPMVLGTRDITNEISTVIGRLIDRLHDEEMCPSFVEEVLDLVDGFLQDIYKDTSHFEDVIVEKDAKIHRLFLLNRSHQVIKFTIDKITIILDRLHTQLTNNNTVFEITNTNKMENINYVLHILECLLKRYTVTKELTSQSITQTSQEEKYLKRSSMSDVWRKKWYPNQATDAQEENVEKRCVERKCVDVLNKIIVQAMDGYSLVSFAALQCFNLLQC